MSHVSSNTILQACALPNALLGEAKIYDVDNNRIVNTVPSLDQLFVAAKFASPDGRVHFEVMPALQFLSEKHVLLQDRLLFTARPGFDMNVIHNIMSSMEVPVFTAETFPRPTITDITGTTDFEPKNNYAEVKYFNLWSGCMEPWGLENRVYWYLMQFEGGAVDKQFMTSFMEFNPVDPEYDLPQKIIYFCVSTPVGKAQQLEEYYKSILDNLENKLLSILVNGTTAMIDVNSLVRPVEQHQQVSLPFAGGAHIPNYGASHANSPSNGAYPAAANYGTTTSQPYGPASVSTGYVSTTTSTGYAAASGYGGAPAAASGYGGAPASGYGGAPAAGGYGAPAAASGYGGAPAAASGYGGAPASGYGGAPAAASGYGGAPASGYGGAPASGYGGAPASGYGGAPASGYGGGGLDMSGIIGALFNNAESILYRDNVKRALTQVLSTGTGAREQAFNAIKGFAKGTKTVKRSANTVVSFNRVPLNLNQLTEFQSNGTITEGPGGAYAFCVTTSGAQGMKPDAKKALIKAIVIAWFKALIEQFGPNFSEADIMAALPGSGGAPSTPVTNYSGSYGAPTAAPTGTYGSAPAVGAYGRPATNAYSNLAITQPGQISNGTSSVYGASSTTSSSTPIQRDLFSYSLEELTKLSKFGLFYRNLEGIITRDIMDADTFEIACKVPIDDFHVQRRHTAGGIIRENEETCLLNGECKTSSSWIINFKVRVYNVDAAESKTVIGHVLKEAFKRLVEDLYKTHAKVIVHFTGAHTYDRYVAEIIINDIEMGAGLDKLNYKGQKMALYPYSGTEKSHFSDDLPLLANYTESPDLLEQDMDECYKSLKEIFQVRERKEEPPAQLLSQMTISNGVSQPYGAPAATSTYGAPAAQPYGAPAATSTYGAPAVTSTYGAPAATSTYGAPAAGGYGAPAAQPYGATSQPYGAPTASTYGAPAASGYGATSQPYTAPTASTYGAPAASGYGATSQPYTAPTAPTASTYGAPAAQPYTAPAASTGGYAPAASTGGYAPAPSTGGYAPAPSTGGYAPAPSTGGYAPAPSTGGYAPAPSTGGYAPAPSTGGYAPAPSTGGYAPAPSTGGYAPAPSTGGYAPAPSTGGYAPAPSTGGYAPAPSTGGYAPAPSTGGYAPAATNYCAPTSQPQINVPANPYFTGEVGSFAGNVEFDGGDDFADTDF
jgi:hypothetical protein